MKRNGNISETVIADIRVEQSNLMNMVIFPKNKDGEMKSGCTFKNEKIAHCWDEWQICSYENCPFIKEGNR